MNKILSEKDIGEVSESVVVPSLLELELSGNEISVESAMVMHDNGLMQLARLSDASGLANTDMSFEARLYILNNICDDLGYPRHTDISSNEDIDAFKEVLITDTTNALTQLMVSNEGIFSKIVNKVKISLKKNESMIADIRAILSNGGDAVKSSDDYKDVVRIIFSELDPIGKVPSKITDSVEEFKLLSNNYNYITIAENFEDNVKKYLSSGQKIAGLSVNPTLKGINSKYSHFLAETIKKAPTEDTVVIGVTVVEKYPTLDPNKVIASAMDNLFGGVTVTLLIAAENPEKSFFKDSLTTYIAGIDHKRHDYSKLDVAVLSKKNIESLLKLVEENAVNLKKAIAILEKAHKTATKLDPSVYITNMMFEIDKASNHFRKRMLLVAKTMADLYKKA